MATKKNTSGNTRTSKTASGSESNSSSGKRTNRSEKTGSSVPNMSQEDHESMLKDLFIEELKDIYWAEKHLVKSLPKMQKAATSEELVTAFGDHLEVTREQVERLDRVFELLGEKPRAKKCEAMEGLVKEAQSVIEDTEEGSATRDVALIIAAQKVEHYEIATYGSMCTLAKTMGNEEIASLLGETLEEEKETDELLTQIAEASINLTAATEQE